MNLALENKIHPIILSGGTGTRLWPVSRKSYPKQFLDLVGDGSLFQQTCKRVSNKLFHNPRILSNEDHRFIVAEQMQLSGITPQAIVLEPVGRNTAPAILIASLLASQENDNALLLILPSDHLIDDNEAFCSTIERGIEKAREGHIVTFGVKPDTPNTGYGYIETAGRNDGVQDVVKFFEKPSLEAAQSYVDAGNFYWNAGIFLFSSQTMIDAFKAHAPEMLQHCEKSLMNAQTDLDFLRLEEASFSQCESISIDYAIMENSSNISCVPLSSDWSDLGSWTAVAEQVPADSNGNAARGDVTFLNSKDCFGHSDDGANLSLLGVENIIVIATKDSILVAAKDSVQNVKELVDIHRQKGTNSLDSHNRVYRPWGWYEGIERGERFQVKCLMVKPGGRLSLQSHVHRAEHWVVVSGTAQVTVGEDVKLLTENESIYIPLGSKHRLENTGKIGALLIEVQSGSYLGEDDIVRYEDVYGRIL